MSDNIMTIHLNDVQFYGYHGLYEEEKKLGNTFIVNLSIDFIPGVNKISFIQETIDYVQVYDLLKERMAIPTPLLETIVEDIASRILIEFPIAHKVTIQITKTQVFINSLNGNMAVTLSKTR
jgi:dihydroneopterin aldolase